jgi:basic membrane lipoprotein Med (substrate-binding protein (PBP1-ABC) superfamily)
MFADTGETIWSFFGADKNMPLKSAAMDYPEQKFSLIRLQVDELPNLHGVGSRDPEHTFLSGVIAGLVTLDPTCLLQTKRMSSASWVAWTSCRRAGAAGFLSGVNM